jgi:tetratricopeptide (TPR) repeat protein
MLDEMPLEAKIRHFEICTSDIGFYRDNYFQINDLASLLAIRYPTDPRVVKLYADHLIASGELERALAHYKLHTADTPPQADYYLTIIDIESYLERPDSVQHYVDRALELFPEKVELHLAEGSVLFRQKRYDEAVRANKASLQYAASDSLRSTIWGQIGDIYHQQAEEAEKESRARKWRKKCYEAYETAIGYNPDNYLVLNNWAYFLSLEERDLEHALEMIERVATLTDNNPTYMDTHAWVLFKLGRLEEARQLLRKAIALDGQKSMELLVHYGDILDAQGQRFMAETYWKRALDKGYDKAAIEERLNRKPAEKKP